MSIKVGELTRTGPRSATIGIGRLGLVVLRAPLVLDCVRLAKAMRDAIGDDGVPRDPSGDELLCVHTAALALSLVVRPEGMPSFREVGRDVVEYGHRALDELVRSRAIGDDGPESAQAISRAGAAVHAWALEVFASDAREGEAAVAAAGFEGPPKGPAPSGGSA